ncbi:hypothetical protein TSAR_000796 [Trichomalopsis sarcophagae]|uniref:Uncharacterized protein n=1 Tax=Trichomalopsis sarcophagae TaxID=543379 RepID=A0A232FLX8_9HYME|nr:hypothetical protein TSAR_000796 [Trichomalopsis sarcophagae]
MRLCQRSHRVRGREEPLGYERDGLDTLKNLTDILDCDIKNEINSGTSGPLYKLVFNFMSSDRSSLTMTPSIANTTSTADAACSTRIGAFLSDYRIIEY